MPSIRKSIPNILTLCNLLSGSIGISMTLANNNLKGAFVAMMISAVFDILDGLSARLLDARSDVGRELDSLSDLISFGLLPGFMMFVFMGNMFEIANVTLYMKYFALLMPAFAALRLAVFNTSEQSLKTFTGLSSPAAAIFVAGLVNNNFVAAMLQKTDYRIGLVIILLLICCVCWLMVSRVKFLSFKFKSFGFKDNYLTYIFYSFSVILFVLFRIDAIILIMCFYVILSLFFAKKIS